MYPAIIQAIAEQRSADMREEAAAWRRTGQTRRSGRPRLRWPQRRIQAAGRGPAGRREPRSLRDLGIA
jgi:hypothetical protein